MTCSVEGCERTSKVRGMCFRHYHNLRDYGYAIPIREWPTEQVMSHIGWDVTEHGCHEWRGNRNDQGYGTITHHKSGLHKARAHRVMYEIAHGPIPDGLHILHSCDNPPCVNPSHLRPGTDAENSADLIERQRHWLHGREVCGEGHDLTAPGATRNYADGSRCVECRRNRHARYVANKRSG